MIHLYRYFAALTVLLVLCSTYALAVAPWLEPPPIVRSAVVEEALPPPQMSDRTMAVVEWLFPPEAWQRKGPKVVETEQCTLLIQDYKRLEDGGLELKPCTLIFHSSRAAGGPGTASRGRPIVLDAPKAEIRFDKPLDLARASFGRVEKGTLSGEIMIFSPPTTPESRDELRVRTRGVWLDRQSIRTANDVDFVYGDSSGRGRELEITFIQSEPGQPRAEKSKFGGIRSVTLRKLEYLRIATAGRGFLGDAIGAGSGDPRTTSDPRTTKREAGDAAPIEVTCQGEFAFDVPGQLARFVEHVEVRRLIPGAPPDSLHCDELLMAFSAPKAARAAETTAGNDPLAGRLQRIIAIGSPAVLEAPSRGLQAVAAVLEYSLADRYVTLMPNDKKSIAQVSLRQNEQHCLAREVHYKLADEGRLGQLQAKGPGELRLLQGRSPQQQIVTARWERELLIQPQERNHVISLLDAASVSVDPLGRFDANELHLWVLEVPAEGTNGAPESANSNKPKVTIVPDRLLAVGKVRVVSPQLDVDTSRLEAWFINLPPEPNKMQPLMPPGPIREPAPAQTAAVQPAGFSAAVVSHVPQPQAAIQNVIRPPNLQKFHVGGGMIQMQLVVRGPQFDLENLNIRGQAEIDEIRTPEPGQAPVRLRGDVLEVRHGTTPEATIEISGHPAEVGGRGMSLAGGNIHVRRGQNEVTIPGPGEATMPAGEGSGFRVQGSVDGGQGPGARGQGPAQRMHITWEQGLAFDGMKARFDGNVVIRTALQTAHAPALEATLSRRIDFQTMGGQPAAELARVFLDGGMPGIYIESRGVNELGEQVSREQMRARNLTIDRLLGKLRADGPGWVSTVRRGGAGLPGAGVGGRGSGVGGQESETAAQGASLSSVHVAFERAMEGDLAQRRIDFLQQVNTTYSPAQDFNDVIAADPLADLGERMVLMQSDVLTLTEFIQPAARWFEMQASGHTKVRGIKADVDAPVIGYSSANEVLTLRGDGRAKAKAWMSQAPGQAPNWVEAEVLRYNLRTGEMQSEGISNLHLNLGQGIKLPQVPSLTPPARQKGRR